MSPHHNNMKLKIILFHDVEELTRIHYKKLDFFLWEALQQSTLFSKRFSTDKLLTGKVLSENKIMTEISRRLNFHEIFNASKFRN